MTDDDARWLEIAGRILDGQPVAWDTMPRDGPSGEASADALRVIAEVADLHRAPAGESLRRWGTLAIQEQIGHGTFGDVYRARDAALDRDVALKLVDVTPSATALGEGRLLARVRHSNVVTVHGAAIHDGRYGVWMEFIRGRTLAAVVREHGRLAVEDVAAIGIDVCRALTAVHASGLLHGDIKPQNVMREDGGRIVVMDFGTGREVTDRVASDRLAGTPLYLAPEVLTGAAPDVQADVYSTGVLIYYLLTGAHPVEGSTLDEVRAAHASGARTPLRSRRPEIPRALAAIVERATAVEPSDRFESAPAFEHAIRESFAKYSRVFTKRVAALIAVTLVIAALGGGYLQSSIASPTLLGGYRSSSIPSPTLHRLTWDRGLTTYPAVSRDGTMLAYASDRASRGNLDIWIGRLSGGDPVRLTSDPVDHSAPDFSPNGMRVAYRSEGNGGGVYVVSSFGGRPILVAPDCRDPKFSPDGQTIACWIGDVGGGFDPKAARIVLVSAYGGPTRTFRSDFDAAAYPLWMPDGRLLFVGRKNDDQGESVIDWWIAGDTPGKGEHPTGAKKAFRDLGLQPSTGAYWIRPEAWRSGGGGAVLFSARRGDVTNVWSIGVSAKGKVSSPPELVTIGTGNDERPTAPAVLAPTDRDSLVFSTVEVDHQLRRVPLTPSIGQPQPLLTGVSQIGSPSASADGRLLVYSARQPNGYRVVAVDMATSSERSMVQSSDFVRALVSGDGKVIVYGGPKHVGYRMRADQGSPEPICQGCGWPTHVNYDGSAALFESINVEERLILWSNGVDPKPLIASSDPKNRRQYAGRFSPNGRWVALCLTAPDGGAREIVVVPYAPDRKLRDDDWVQISEGTSDREPAWSPDGRQLFFISERDGFRCIWKRDVDPQTGRPLGHVEPVAHFHYRGELLQGPMPSLGSIGLTASAKGLVFTVARSVGNLWLQRIVR
jgi:serine/threonine protein kinase/Tol biopolymer transport system component